MKKKNPAIALFCTKLNVHVLKKHQKKTVCLFSYYCLAWLVISLLTSLLYPEESLRRIRIVRFGNYKKTSPNVTPFFVNWCMYTIFSNRAITSPFGYSFWMSAIDVFTKQCWLGSLKRITQWRKCTVNSRTVSNYPMNVKYATTGEVKCLLANNCIYQAIVNPTILLKLSRERTLTFQLYYAVAFFRVKRQYFFLFNFKRIVWLGRPWWIYTNMLLVYSLFLRLAVSFQVSSWSATSSDKVGVK